MVRHYRRTIPHNTILGVDDHEDGWMIKTCCSSLIVCKVQSHRSPCFSPIQAATCLMVHHYWRTLLPHNTILGVGAHEDGWMTKYLTVVWLCTRHNLIAKVCCVVRTRVSSTVCISWCVCVYICVYVCVCCVLLLARVPLFSISQGSPESTRFWYSPQTLKTFPLPHKKRRLGMSFLIPVLSSTYSSLGGCQSIAK